MQVLSDELLEKFRRCVYEKSDLHFSGRKLTLLETRLRDRLARSGLRDYEEYYAYLVSNPDEAYGLVEDLTTNETRFFRNPGQFKALAGKVVPAIIEARNREVAGSWGKGETPAAGRHPAMSIRIWSAGCSTGEEAYSIAFTLLGAVRYPRAWDLEVFATDIKRDALAYARRGIYTDASVRAIEPAVRDAYMERTEGGWSVREDARRVVGFYAANIRDVTSPGGPRKLGIEDAGGSTMPVDVRGRFDAVFCRNVMIYFNRDGQQRLVDALYDCLRPGGYLFTGDSEPLHLFSHGFKRADDEGALYYVKPE